MDCGVRKVGVGRQELSMELVGALFGDISEKLRLERLRLRSRWFGCSSSEVPAKLVVNL